MKRQIEAQSVEKVNAYVKQLEAHSRQKVNDAILKDRAAVQSHVQEERAAMAREKEWLEKELRTAKETQAGQGMQWAREQWQQLEQQRADPEPLPPQPSAAPAPAPAPPPASQQRQPHNLRCGTQFSHAGSTAPTAPAVHAAAEVQQARQKVAVVQAQNLAQQAVASQQAPRQAAPQAQLLAPQAQQPGELAQSPHTVGQQAPSFDVEFTVVDGAAGFTCHQDLNVQGVKPGTPALLAGLSGDPPGMRLVIFNGQTLRNETWDGVKTKVKAAPRPWTFKFKRLPATAAGPATTNAMATWVANQSELGAAARVPAASTAVPCADATHASTAPAGKAVADERTANPNPNQSDTDDTEKNKRRARETIQMMAEKKRRLVQEAGNAWPCTS
jgi:hypothetical protein